MLSSILTFLLASASAMAVSQNAQNDFYLISIRPGSDVHFNTINVRDGKLALGGEGYPADLHLDGDVLVSNASGESFALAEMSLFDSSSERSPAHGFSIQDDYLTFGNNTLFACPGDNSYWLGVDCEGGIPVMLRVLLPYTTLKKREVEELAASYVDGHKGKRHPDKHFNDLTKPFRPPFGMNKTYFDRPTTFLTRYQGGFFPIEQPHIDVSSAKTTKNGIRRGPRFQRDYEGSATSATQADYEDYASSVTEAPEPELTIQTVTFQPSQIPNTEIYNFVSITPYSPHSMSGEIGKRHFVQWWLQFTERLRPKTKHDSCSSTSNTSLATSSSSLTFSNSSSITTSR